MERYGVKCVGDYATGEVWRPLETLPSKGHYGRHLVRTLCPFTLGYGLRTRVGYGLGRLRGCAGLGRQNRGRHRKVSLLFTSKPPVRRTKMDPFSVTSSSSTFLLLVRQGNTNSPVGSGTWDSALGTRLVTKRHRRVERKYTPGKGFCPVEEEFSSLRVEGKENPRWGKR